MVTAVAHDLRTPLFTLRGSLEALERGVGDGRYLDRAQEKAAHLDRPVSDLFTFSRLEYAREAIAFAEVDVGELARRAVEGVEPLAAARGCAVTLGRVPRGLVVRGDADALRGCSQICSTTRSATVAGTSCSARSARAATCASRSPTTAPGSPPTTCPTRSSRCFARTGPAPRRPVARASAWRSHGGSTRAHGGDVEAANDPGGGARTTVILPAASAPAPSPAAHGRRSQAPSR